MAPQETIVIIGASFSGLYTAHIILKTLPKTSPNSRVVLINPTTSFFWNIAAPRVLTSDLLSSSDLFEDFLPHFQKYPAANFQFIQGVAAAVDASKQTVAVRTSAGAAETVSYTQLVVATGAKGPEDLPWKSTPGLDLAGKIAEWKAKIAAANSVVISGGGPTAIETAGELATENPGKKTVLVAGEGLLPRLPAVAGQEAERQLKALGVEVIKGTTVTGRLEDGSGVRLADGKVVQAEVYVPAHGVYPTTEFLPKEWVDPKGWLSTDSYLRVKGTKNVWGVGDVVDVSYRNAASVNETSLYVGGALKKVVAGTWAEDKEKKFAFGVANKPVALVPVGKNGGTGYLFFFRAWNWLVWYLKSKDFMVKSVKIVVEGEKNTMGAKL